MPCIFRCVFISCRRSVPLGSTPEQLRARYLHWMGIFEKIAKDAGVKPQ